MRIVVALLLLANLGYAGWYFYTGHDTGEAAPVYSPSRPAPQTLLLLNEARSRICFDVGGFAGRADSERFAGHVRQMGYDTVLTPRQVADLPHYWVLIAPPVIAPAGSDDPVELLRESGVDHYVISGGELDQGVSLGIFPTPQLAQLQQERVLELDFAAEIREIQRTRTELMVQVQGAADRVSQTEELREYLDGRTELLVSEKLCETIAPRD